MSYPPLDLNGIGPDQLIKVNATGDGWEFVDESTYQGGGGGSPTASDVTQAGANPAANVQLALDDLETRLQALEAAVFPTGAIVYWPDANGPVPGGWGEEGQQPPVRDQLSQPIPGRWIVAP